MSENNENEVQAPQGENQSAPAPESVDSSGVSYDEIVEIPWEKAENIFRIRESVRDMQQSIANFLLDAERRKSALIDRLANLENSLYAAADQLKESTPVNPDWIYELKLPQQPEEKAYLIRKQE